MENQEVTSAWLHFCFSQEEEELNQGCLSFHVPFWSFTRLLSEQFSVTCFTFFHSYTHVSGSSPASSQTSSFLCELKRFLGDVLPQNQPESPLLQLNSLQSLPPLTLGLSSSETLLAGLMNSSAPTIFSFASWGSVFQVHHRELALSPTLLEELRQRLEQTVMQVMGVIREEEVGHRATQRLGRLKELSAFPKKEPAAGDVYKKTVLRQLYLHYS